MFKCKLTKISRPDVPGGLRTEFVVGEAASQPTVGKSFLLTADPLAPGTDIRVVRTTSVKSIAANRRDPHIVKFTTDTGSVYLMEYLGELEAHAAGVLGVDVADVCDGCGNSLIDCTCTN
jgi:hypothetical protein